MENLDLALRRDEFKTTTDPKKKLEMALNVAELEPEQMRPIIMHLDPTCVEAPEAITIKFGDHKFHPEVAYPIFVADYIRGYEEPKLELEFDSMSLLPFASFTCKKKVDENATDPIELFRKVMPGPVYKDRAEYEQQVQVARSTLLERYGSPIGSVGKVNSVYVLSFANPTERAFLERMFVFCLFFIEGARMPDSMDDTWEMYVLAQKGRHSFVGYASVYSFFYYTSGAQFDADAADFRLVRERIAQFLVLPPFQKQGLGSQLYLLMLDRLVNNKAVRAIEIEDPSPGFELLRDRSNFRWLTSNEEARDLLEQYPQYPETTLKVLEEKFKLGKAQFMRAAELLLYSESDYKETRELKKLIKQRLWAHNYEALRDMDHSEQREKLQGGYEQVLRSHRVALHLEEPEDENEQEEEDEDEEGDEPEDAPYKRRRTE